MQIQQITVFLAACTLSVLVVAYASNEPDTQLLLRLRDLAARAAAGEVPDLFGDSDDYKRGHGGKKNMGIYVHSGLNFGKRRDSESGEAARTLKRMRYHKGISFGKRSPVQSWQPWDEEDAFNPDWDLTQFN